MPITNIIGWAEGINDYIANTPLEIYARVPLVYRCANIVADSASTTPVYTMYNDEQTEFPYDVELHELIRRACLDLQIYGASYILRVADGRGNVRTLRRLNPNGMTVKLVGTNDDGTPRFHFTHNVSGYGVQTKQAEYTHEEIIYIRYDGESQDVIPDVYPARVALGSGKVLNYLALFGEKYFESGAMPTTIVSVKEGSSKSQIDKLEQWIKRRIQGLVNRTPFGVMALSSDIAINTLNPPASELAIPELDMLNRKRVIEAFGVPEAMIEKSANYASAQSHTRQFWDMTVQPITNLVIHSINRQHFKGSNYHLVANYQELSVYQQDEQRRSGALLNMVNAGVSLEASWYTLGYADLPDDIELIGFTPDVEDGDNRPQIEDGDNDVRSINGVATKPSLFTHLDAWRRKAHNRIRENKSLDFSFDSEYIPTSVQSAIRGTLEETTPTHEDVDAVFDHVINLHDSHSWEGY